MSNDPTPTETTPVLLHPKWCARQFCDLTSVGANHLRPVVVHDADASDTQISVYRARMDEKLEAEQWLAGSEEVRIHVRDTAFIYVIDGEEVDREVDIFLSPASCREFAAQLTALADRIEAGQ